MCMCAAEIKVCTYAGRVRARLALDAGKRTRRPCYNVFTSFSQTTPVRYHLQYHWILHTSAISTPVQYDHWTKLSMDMSANGPVLDWCKANLKQYLLAWPSPVRSCLAHTASCWQRSPCNAILNTYLQERLVTGNDHHQWDWKPSVCELENTSLVVMKYLLANNAKHAQTYSTRTMCSPDAEEYAPALQSVQLTSLVDPEIKKK